MNDLALDAAIAEQLELVKLNRCDPSLVALYGEGLAYLRSIKAARAFAKIASTK